METTTPKSPNKQFDVSHLRVAENLQGAHLAEFPRRFLAFAIDWGLIWLALQYKSAIFLFFIALIILKKRGFNIVKTTTEIAQTVADFAVTRINNTDIDKKLISRFSRYIKFYMYALMYAPMLIMSVLTGFWVYKIISEKGSAFKMEEFKIQPFAEMFSALDFLAGFLGATLYFTLFTWKWEGQTIGKRVSGIRIVKLNGEPITLWNSFERFGGYSSSASLLLLGFFQYFWDKNHQTTHDKISETIVIKNP